jgi:hypothetical protein
MFVLPINSILLPSSGVTAGTGTAWVDQENVLNDNDANATFSTSAGFSTTNATSQNLNATGLGFAIPLNATIMGI